MYSFSNFLFYTLVIFGGVFLELFVSKLYYWATKSEYKQHHFTLSRYLFLLLAPLLAFLYLSLNHGYPPIQVFLIFAFFGTLLEGLVGYSYHKIVGQRLWTYHRLSIFGYTSLLGTPIWGLLGILTWLLAKALV